MKYLNKRKFPRGIKRLHAGSQLLLHIVGLINNNQIEVVPTVLRLGLTIEPIGLNLLIQGV